MATIGTRQLPKPVFDLFDGLRSYDLKKAGAQLADDVDLQTPWGGKVTGKAAVEAAFTAWLGDAKTRPSLTIADLAGDGAVNRITVSQSGRFGQNPQRQVWHVLCLGGKVQNFTIVAEGAGAGHH